MNSLHDEQVRYPTSDAHTSKNRRAAGPTAIWRGGACRRPRPETFCVFGSRKRSRGLMETSGEGINVAQRYENTLAHWTLPSYDRLHDSQSAAWA